MVSVIVPFKDAERWIDRCVESLKQQSGDFEFIFINDGSDGDIPNGGRFVSLRNEHAPGVSEARNTGLDYARGEWVTFLDADDEMLPDAWRAFSKIEDDEVYQFNHLRHYSKTGREVLKYWNDAGRYTMNEPPRVWYSVWNKVYRRDFIEGLKFDENLQYGEDLLFNLECFGRGMKITHAAKDALTVRRYFENKESLSHIRTAKDLMKQVRAYEDFLMREKDRDVRKFVCKVLSEHWSSKTYKKVFCE